MPVLELCGTERQECIDMTFKPWLVDDVVTLINEYANSIFSTKLSDLTHHAVDMIVKEEWQACKFCQLKFPEEDEIKTPAGVLMGVRRRMFLRKSIDPHHTYITKRRGGVCSICIRDIIDLNWCAFCCLTCKDNINLYEDCKDCKDRSKVLVRRLFHYSPLFGGVSSTLACSTCFFNPKKIQEATRRIQALEHDQFYPLAKYKNNTCRLCSEKNVKLITPNRSTSEGLDRGLYVCRGCCPDSTTYEYKINHLKTCLKVALNDAHKMKIRYNLREVSLSTV